MKIEIKNIDAFRLCQAATSDAKDYQRIFRGILIQRDGTIVGTDGFCLTNSRNAVEWVEDETDVDSVVIQFEKTIPKGIKAATLDFDLEKGTGILHMKTAKGSKAMTATLIEGTFPDWERVAGQDTEDCTLVTNRSILNPAIQMQLLKVLPRTPHSYEWRFRANGVIAYIIADKDTEAFIVPLRTGGQHFTIPLLEQMNTEGLREHLSERELDKAA